MSDEVCIEGTSHLSSLILSTIISSIFLLVSSFLLILFYLVEVYEYLNSLSKNKESSRLIYKGVKTSLPRNVYNKVLFNRGFVSLNSGIYK